MVFQPSKDYPLYYGFSSIQRLSTVLWFFIHPKTVHCTMVFQPSKDYPLYYGFSSIQRLSTVLWFFIHPKTVHCTMVFHSSKDCPLHYGFPSPRTMFLQFPLSCTLSPRLLTLGLIHPSIFLFVFPSFVFPLLLIL